MGPDRKQTLAVQGMTGISKAYIFLFLLMALTGFAQMPIFKRYYIADIPGLGWLADYYFTHTLHYIGASLLLFLLAYCAAAYLMALRHRYQLTGAAVVRLVLMAAIVATGVVRVLKNLPDVAFSPGVTMAVDIFHLGFMMAFAVAALVIKLTGKTWLTERAVL